MPSATRPERDVEAVEAGEREEGRREEAAVHRDAAVEELRVLARLAAHEDAPEEQRDDAAIRGRPPALAALEALLREVEREAAREQARREDAGRLDVERGGRRLRREVEEDVRQDEDDEEPGLRDDERPDGDDALVRRRRSPLRSPRRARVSRPGGRDPRAGAGSAHGGTRSKLWGGRRGRRPLERPRVPGVVPGDSPAAQAKGPRMGKLINFGIDRIARA